MVKFYIIQKSQVSSAPVPQQPDVQSISKLKAQIFFFLFFFFFLFCTYGKDLNRTKRGYVSWSWKFPELSTGCNISSTEAADSRRQS